MLRIQQFVKLTSVIVRMPHHYNRPDYIRPCSAMNEKFTL
jgi:hypothetical protein